MYHFIGSDANPKTLYGIHDSLYHVRWRLKYIGPYKVEEMYEGVFTAETKHAEWHVLDGGTGCLPMDKISVMEATVENNG